MLIIESRVNSQGLERGRLSGPSFSLWDFPFIKNSASNNERNPGQELWSCFSGQYKIWRTTFCSVRDERDPYPLSTSLTYSHSSSPCGAYNLFKTHPHLWRRTSVWYGTLRMRVQRRVELPNITPSTILHYVLRASTKVWRDNSHGGSKREEGSAKSPLQQEDLRAFQLWISNRTDCCFCPISSLETT